MDQLPSRQVWDERYEHYYQLADVLRTVAESHCNTRIDGTTAQRWRELMGVMREIDTHTDSGEASADDVLRELQSFDNFTAAYPSLTPEALGQKMHERLVWRTEKILTLGRLIGRASTPYRYMCLRAAEAIQTAEVFSDSATADVREQPHFAQRFMPLLRTMGMAACFLDSARDAAHDFAEKQTSLPPSFLHRARLLGASASRLPAMSGVVWHRPVLRELLIAARIHFSDK